MILSEQELKDGGWIENEGKQPVEDDVAVDVITREGKILKSRPYFIDWSLVDSYPTPYDIIHWRLHKPENDVESTLYTHPSVEENAPKSLDDAYDNPLSKSIEDMIAQMPTEESYYKAPETKPVPAKPISTEPIKVLYLKKKSVEQMAVEIFNQITGNCLTEKNVKDIISLVAVINEIKGE